MSELLQILLSFSERAGEIARSIRREPKLFSLLVEEKGETEKNQRFTHDFKTLADVLIQEALRHHIKTMIPSLEDYVQGEESAEFTNTLGEKITVKICETEKETANLLAKVLDGNAEAAELLAAVVHSDITLQLETELAPKIPELPINNLGIWIDPIDSTGEYVNGKSGVCQGKVYKSGLPCVTVLIGIYDRVSGLPVGGVVNQPFGVFDEESQRWRGKAYWGVSHSGVNVHNIQVSSPSSETENKVVVISSSEGVSFQEMLKKKFDVVHATGAGYKLLSVALGHAVAYICSKNSTFRWDTAAPHGILSAEGGGVVKYKEILKRHLSQEPSREELQALQVNYHKPNTASPIWCNEGGFIAYRSPSIIPVILDCLKDT
ncbi:inositol polyphosphate 1-phosphatase [Macrobrachium rosenbergii]|uniref:inositol polyphosphate 1-phosphatase n=1 Tax=Macrobrachium rosenbergii TaxID=79674 RepID=UPI0034D65AF2